MGKRISAKEPALGKKEKKEDEKAKAHVKMLLDDEKSKADEKKKDEGDKKEKDKPHEEPFEPAQPGPNPTIIRPEEHTTPPPGPYDKTEGENSKAPEATPPATE